MARSPMLDVGGSNSRSKRCSTGLENHFGKNDPLWIFNPLSSGSSPKHYLKCLFEVFEVQFMYLCYLGSMFKWSLWILGNDCKHQRKQRNVWVQASSLPGNLWLIVVPSWVLKIEFDVISELVGLMFCVMQRIPLSNGRHEKLDLLWLFIEIMPATTSSLKLFKSWKYKKAGKIIFSLFWVIFKQKWPPEFSLKRYYLNFFRDAHAGIVGKGKHSLKETREEFCKC